MKLTIPELSLVLLIGPSGCGKSTFARKHFKPSEIISSDFYRGVVCDDEANQAASREAFDLVHQVVARRLQWKRFTVVDATNLQADARKPLLELARKYHYLTGAIVFDLGEDVCQQHNLRRPGRTVPTRVIATHTQMLRKALEALDREGIHRVFSFRSVEEMETAIVHRVPLWVDRRHDHGPFDVIGDVHGCIDELAELLARLGYRVGHQPDTFGSLHLVAEPPPGRQAVFVGDLGDRGPDTPAVYRLVMHMVASGRALCVMGNHDHKLLRKLRGNDVKLTHGLADTMEQFGREPAELSAQVRRFLEDLESHYVFDDGKLVVAHAGLREDLQGRASGKVRTFAMFGDVTGESDEHGLPIRLNWAADYRGQAMVLYGHTPVAEPAWQNNTMNIDTGCVFGGRLSALRYPEREVISVPSRRTYCEPVRPFLTVEASGGREPPDTPSHQGAHAPRSPDEVLDSADVQGTRVVATRLLGNVTVAAENSAAALEVLRRFAVNPRWLIYLPPMLSTALASKHPGEAFAYYRSQDIPRVVCQEQHKGSRAVVVVCKDEAAAQRHFGVEGGGIGTLYSGTGGRVFDGATLGVDLLARLNAALTRAGWWQRFDSDWFCLDAAVAASGQAAPFHLLASANAVHADRPHPWHLEQLAALAMQDKEVLVATASLEVDVNDRTSVQRGVAWWEGLKKGGEGMVVKPIDFVARGPRGLVQPAVSCLGPKYQTTENPDRLRQQGLSVKRGLALREFALGVEALERFVRREPLRQVQECCLAILALQSEPA